MKVTISSLNTRGVFLEGENPLPLFRARKHDGGGQVDENFTEKEAKLFGYETGFRVLPYRMQDRYTRDKKPIQLKTIILENDKLKATFLCDYGSKLHSLIRKSDNKELLFSNSVIQPGNLAIRNAWTSGGIEWNIGQLGHTFTTCEPLFMTKMIDDKGNEFIRAYEYERCKGLFWHIDFHLPKGSELLYAYVRIVNIKKEPSSMYWWTNIAVPETQKTRVFSNSSRVMFPHAGKFRMGNLPYLASVENEDVSYPRAFPFANEFFFQIDENEKMPWEAVAYEDGSLFIEASTDRLHYRKMFCWGNKQGGQHWQDYLSEPGKGNYVEVQGGMAPTQVHGLSMPAETTWDFIQAFGETTVDIDSAYNKDWEKARKKVEKRLRRSINSGKLYKMQDKCRKLALRTPVNILNTGSGWGALEQTRLQKHALSIPKGFYFPQASISSEQLPWLDLLNNGALYEKQPTDIPESWMVQDEWKAILEESLQTAANQNWYAYMHLGNMFYEKGEDDRAFELWNKSIEIQPSAWVYRNLAYAENQKGNKEEALFYMEKAYSIYKSFSDAAFYEEYFNMLMAKREYQKIWDIYQSMPASFQALHRIQILAGKVALELDNLEFAYRLFDREYAVIREGELTIVDLWYYYSAKKLAKERGIEYTKELLEEAKEKCPPPHTVDYRMN
ncbi:MAG: hypothetical protein K0S55_139 [Clostridia bacterium]|nr:hypothetical protein [Clostridia bacterium]